MAEQLSRKLTRIHELEATQSQGGRNSERQPFLLHNIRADDQQTGRDIDPVDVLPRRQGGLAHDGRQVGLAGEGWKRNGRGRAYGWPVVPLELKEGGAGQTPELEEREKRKEFNGLNLESGLDSCRSPYETGLDWAGEVDGGSETSGFVGDIFLPLPN